MNVLSSGEGHGIHIGRIPMEINDCFKCHNTNEKCYCLFFTESWGDLVDTGIPLVRTASDMSAKLI